MRCAGGGFSNVVDIFDASSGRWSTAYLSLARYSLAATSLPNQGLAIFAGGQKNGLFDFSSDVVDMFAWCRLGCYVASNNSRLPCPPAHYSDQYGATACRACNAGSYNPGGRPAPSCTLCDAGSYSGDGQAACTLCDAGRFNPSNGSKSISACLYCTAGSYSLQGSASCTICNAGSYSGGGQPTCTLCDAGSYSGDGQAACTLCDAGRYNPSNGSKSISACLYCTAGSYSLQGSASCTICNAGSYSGGGQPTCTYCDPGYYNPSPESTSASACLPCDLGYYCIQKGLAQQVRCPSGNYCPSSLQAIPCPAGTYSPESGALQQNTLSCTLSMHPMMFLTHAMQVKHPNPRAAPAPRRRAAPQAPPVPPQPSHPRAPPPIRS
jgi:hypothetical protein